MARLFLTAELEIFLQSDITFLPFRYNKINLTMQMRHEHAYDVYEEFTEK